MTDDPMTVVKYGHTMAFTPEAVDSLNAAAREIFDLPRRLERALNATPEERAERARAWAQREAEATRERAEQRASTETIPLTVEAIMAKMDWDREFAEHLVQPYCECHEDSEGGWSYCEHARDLGLAP